ncbi:beta-mannosidase [Deinococcus cellulosilyticus]|uniref:Beta-mannosidase B n=1 Tax=Deinococcus cellulosilyticus (strain DSM 18568 / NBRC 106333 / KACC 11606 / 5516J-15) TaxID=1223518 RepID=A0A511N619_DEIC1|nr:glycoside hydrolase family 2 protein [Deinococcus cellulosilyticus]GEM47876.1 beta-mannosidase [Deinococcus cellulosilyticus NBRC 106333 = KACC 11606]
MIEHLLHSGWTLKARTPSLSLQADFQTQEGWTPATVPGTVQWDLLKTGQIDDPFYGLNEKTVQWIGEDEWLYSTEFTVTSADLQAEHVELHFEGLDTLCTVWLNGQQILVSDNMFVPRTINVKSCLQEGLNTLQLVFESPLEKGRELEAQHGRRPVWNGDHSRVYVRKAQYHYGWDWGPVLLTAGPWKPIRLRAFTARIDDVYAPVEVTPDLHSALVPVQVQLAGTLTDQILHITLLGPDGQVVQQQQVQASESSQVLFQVDAPELWFPNGYGKQPLYTLQVRLQAGNEVLDQKQLRLGMRRLRVVQEAVLGESGRSFYFEVNNQPIFSGGANWIPDDLILNRISDEQYRRRLTQAKDANMNMIRVWGGGIYEADVFYDLCDELGLLVWQDFMFGCGMYPAHESFRASVQQEAEAQVKRLRNHTSIALWCGNNEDYQIAQSVGAYGPGGDESKFDAKVIYEVLLREVCERLDPGTLYWPGSPYGGDDVYTGLTGDRHTWEIWHAQMAPYQEYKNFEGRFVSEFGMMSAPSLALIQQSMPEAEWFPESQTFVHHTKATGPNGKPDGARRLAVYQAENLRGHRNLEEYIYNTQLVQAEAMRYAYRDFRKRFEGPGKYAVSGALVWQLNDCWPVSSWAIIDSLEIPKPAYFTIKRELSTFSVGIQKTRDLEVWVSSGSFKTHEATLHLHAYNLQGEWVSSTTRTVTLLPNRRTDVEAWQLDTSPLIHFAELLIDDQVVARSSEFPEPYKYFHFADPQLQLEYLNDHSIRITAQKPVKGVWLDAGASVGWNDNFIDLRAGESRVLEAPDLAGRTVQVRYLGADQATQVKPAVVGA